MSDFTLYQYSDSDLTAFANQAKESIIFALANEGMLNGDPVEISQNYVIVLYKKGWFGRQWDKWRSIEKGSYFAVLKNVRLDFPSDDEVETKAKVIPLKVVPKDKED